jgi:hypothetical protein
MRPAPRRFCDELAAVLNRTERQAELIVRVPGGETIHQSLTDQDHR